MIYSKYSYETQFFQLIDLIVVKNQPIFLNDIFLTLTGLLNTIFGKKFCAYHHRRIQIRIDLVTLVMTPYGR